MKFAVFVKIAVAETIYEAVWHSDEKCTGPPTTMSIFKVNENNIDNLSSELTDFYSFRIIEYQVGTCGNYPLELSKGCCYSSLDLSDSKGIQSGSHELFLGTASAPRSANGHSYCHTKLNTTVYYQLADGNCYGDLMCTPDGLQSCDSSTNLTTTAQIFEGGTTEYIWTALTPSSKLVPTFKAAADYIGVAGFILAVLGALSVEWFFINKYISKRTKYMKYFLISQTLWLLWVLLKFGYYVHPWPYQSVVAFAWCSEVVNIVFNLATLTTICNSNMFILQFTRRQSRSWQIATYGTIFFLHIMFSGALYFDYCRLVGSYQALIKTWNKLTIFWIVLLLSYDMFPSILVTTELLSALDNRQRTLLHRLKALHSERKVFSMLALCQILNTIVFAVIDITKQNTTFLGGDRFFLMIDGVLAFCLINHSILNCLFIENVGLIAKIKINAAMSLSSKDSKI